MILTWGSFWQRSRKWLKAGWLVTAGLVALYVGMIQPREMARGIASSRSAGLAAASREPLSLWRTRSPRLADYYPGESKSPVLMAQLGTTGVEAAPTPPTPESSEERRLIRTAAIDLVVTNPASAAESIRKLAEDDGGFLSSSQVSGAQNASSATVSIRVPVERFEQVRTAIRALGLRVENDRLEAQDVTKDYVDREARLKNLRAQEQQYLGILKRTTTVKDTLEVSEQLNRVRAEIEQQQAEFEALSKQTETVEITVSLAAEADVSVFGIYWHPLFRLKMAAREGLESVGDYFAAMVSLAFYLPTILLWLVTILLGSALGWRFLRWAARVFFSFPKKAITEKGAN